ncbi:hypothetical protein G6O67_008065 [Ophiocordyceps sinensis]|uniref:Uncharacterized protein n=1 Tax=Ophiocordyceps sinensis TaxID=72228 RepID=A0A8H4PJN3_9HYPO|nr:hypothetical protein G6O67_008065 [Ophiocordyceps sinensis]
MLEKSLPLRSRSLARPMTAAYCEIQSSMPEPKARTRDAHVENDLVEELHGVAAKHERHNVQVDLAAQRGEVDGGHALDMAVTVEELPGGVDRGRGRAGSGRERGRGADVAESDVVAHLVVADGRHGEDWERGQTGKGQTGKGQTGKGQTGKGQTGKGQTGKGQTERARRKGPDGKGQTKRGQLGKARAG